MKENYKFVDANIFLRFLTNDHREKTDRCEKLFKEAVEGNFTLYTSELVIAELVWTLESFYKFPKKEIGSKLELLLNTPNLEVRDKDILLEALLIYREKNIDFIDAYNGVFMKYNLIKEIYSYDKDMDRISVIKRLEP